MNAIEERMSVPSWNDTAAAYPGDRCLHQIFEEQVDRDPHATALVIGRERWSYRELEDRCNQVAHYLKERGIRQGI